MADDILDLALERELARAADAVVGVEVEEGVAEAAEAQAPEIVSPEEETRRKIAAADARAARDGVPHLIIELDDDAAEPGGVERAAEGLREDSADASDIIAETLQEIAEGSPRERDASTETNAGLALGDSNPNEVRPGEGEPVALLVTEPTLIEAGGTGQPLGGGSR